MIKISFYLFCCFIFIAFSGKRTATNNSFAACSLMIANLDDGDTGYIPYGVAVWKRPIIIENKKICIIGITEGNKKPVIIDSVPTGYKNSPLSFSVRRNDTVRVSNLQFFAMVPKNMGSIYVEKTEALRVSNCIFSDSIAECRALYLNYGVRGVIDNCIINVRNDKTTQGIIMIGDGADSWNRPSSFGSNDNFFIEDCKFNFAFDNDGAFDASNGARIVFRNNFVIGTFFGWHGFDSQGTYRSTFSGEIYNNTISNGGTLQYTCMRLRGGSALIFNNIITGNYSRFFILSNYRSCGNFEGFHTGGTGLLLIDTSASFSGSNVKYVYKIETGEIDTVVSFTATTVTTKGHIVWENNDHYAIRYFYEECGMCFGKSPCDINKQGLQGYPCLDQAGRGTNQTLSPVYAWNNNFNGNTTPSFTVGYECEREVVHIQKNRDYFENTAKPEYKQYRFPHPLRLADQRNSKQRPRNIHVLKTVSN